MFERLRVRLEHHGHCTLFMGVVEIFCQLKSVKENFYQGKEPSKPSKLGPSFPLKMHKNGITQKDPIQKSSDSYFWIV